LKFLGEVWAGRACAKANEKELTTCAQKGGPEFEKIGGNVQKIGGAQSWPATSGRPLAVVWALTNCGTSIFCNFVIFFLLFFLEVWKMG
jgi:hypothetical protein